MHHDVRVATPGDAAGVTALLEASYPLLTQSAYDAAEFAPALALMTRAQPALLASGTYYVAESPEGLIVGCGGWTRERPGDRVVQEGVGHIRHFGTHPEWIKRGIGRAIYGRCEAGARGAGLTRLECYSLLNAEPFYAALGFERVRRIEVPLTPGVSVAGVLMHRAI